MFPVADLQQAAQAADPGLNLDARAVERLRRRSRNFSRGVLRHYQVEAVLGRCAGIFLALSTSRVLGIAAPEIATSVATAYAAREGWGLALDVETAQELAAQARTRAPWLRLSAPVVAAFEGLMTGPDATENPTPLAWRELPPNTPYPMREGDPLAGEAISRHDAISAAATPSEDRPHEGQVWVGLPAPGFGHPIRRSRARRMVQRLRHPPQRCDCQVSAYDADAVLTEHVRALDLPHIPSPPPLEFPHEPGKARSCRYHPLWAELFELLEAYADRGADDAETLAGLEASPRWGTWVSLERQCVQAAQDRSRRRAPRDRRSWAAERGARRRRARARGEDFGAKAVREYLETGLYEPNPDARALAVRGARAVRGAAHRAAPHVKRAAKATARAAKAAGHAVRRGAKRAAPHVARGARGLADRLDAWATKNPGRAWYWCAGEYCCPHNHRTPSAAVSCARRFVAEGSVQILPR